MENQKNNIGIWGLGAVGISALSYFNKFGKRLMAIDQKEPLGATKDFLDQNKIDFKIQTPETIKNLLAHCDKILASPGIDLTSYAEYKEKLITEADIFFDEFKKPIIAITGSVGKTTITHLIAQILAYYNFNVLCGGNIGTPMLDLLSQKDSCDLAVLEISSFQLEHVKKFAPNIAILTNLYPNHLDRHHNIASYLQAKLNIAKFQNKNDLLIVNQDLKNNLPNFAQEVWQFSKNCTDSQNAFFIENKKIFKSAKHIIFDLEKLSLENQNLTYDINWVPIILTLKKLNLDLGKLSFLPAINLPAHRLELIRKINNTQFYDDSKSTTINSTLEALEKMQGKKILLFLGGVSKGVDRIKELYKLKNKVDIVFCFGKEADSLYTELQNLGIRSENFRDLDEACQEIKFILNELDCVIFSPAGASFDLFKDYKERGQKFKELVNRL